eukprot:8787726-Pyramimonas_sp.AAC.1
MPPPLCSAAPRGGLPRFGTPEISTGKWARGPTADAVQDRQRPLLDRRPVVSNGQRPRRYRQRIRFRICLLYTSDAADDTPC